VSTVPHLPLDVCGIIQRFLENLLESENLVCSAAARKKGHILQHYFNYFVALFFKALGTDLKNSKQNQIICLGQRVNLDTFNSDTVWDRCMVAKEYCIEQGSQTQIAPWAT